jgi:hypothetical protein
VPELERELDDIDAFVEEQAREAAAQITRAGVARQADGRGRRLEHPLAQAVPASPVPQLGGGGGKHEPLFEWRALQPPTASTTSTSIAGSDERRGLQQRSRMPRRARGHGCSADAQVHELWSIGDIVGSGPTQHRHEHDPREFARSRWPEALVSGHWATGTAAPKTPACAVGPPVGLLLSRGCTFRRRSSCRALTSRHGRQSAEPRRRYTRTQQTALSAEQSRRSDTSGRDPRS